MNYTALILAAGKSTRMQSPIPKAFAEIAFFPAIFHLIETIISTMANEIVIVIGALFTEIYKNRVLDFVNNRIKIEFSVQQNPLGTANAVQTFLNLKEPSQKKMVIFYADVPLITKSIILSLLKKLELGTDGVFCAFKSQNRGNYGRIEINANEPEIISRIIEFSDDFLENKNTQLPYIILNSGILASWQNRLKELIAKIEAAKNGEYYLVDVAKFGRFKICFGQKSLLRGFNTQAELGLLERTWQKFERKVKKSEIYLINPETTYFSIGNLFDPSVKIGPNVTFKSNIRLEFGVIIEENSVIGPNVVIQRNTKILPFTVISNSNIGPNCQIGPFSHIHSSSVIQNDCQIGNFVEIKNSKLGSKNKSKHLTYIGDCETGEENNFGAGFVVCNFDGKKKHRTTIGDRNFLGANSLVIAPISVGNDSIIAAGSVITEDISSNKLAIARKRQEIKDLQKNRKDSNLSLDDEDEKR